MFYPPSGGTPLAILDEGVSITPNASSIDFTGTGVTATAVGTAVTANITSGGGSGTVTSVSVVSANGFAGTVATDTTTPAITLTTTVTGILSGNGTAISAASTTGSGAVVLATGPTLAGATMSADLDFGGNDLVSVGNVTFQTGATGGLLRTGTSAADKYVLQAYDVNGMAYVDVARADAGTSPTYTVYTGSLMLADTADPTKLLTFDLTGQTTSKTVTLASVATDDRTLTLPDATGTLALTSDLTGFVTVDQSVPQTIGSTGDRLTKLWATDITVTNAIDGSVTGNAATVTTNANLTGDVTSVGNATTLVGGTSPSFTTSIVTASTTFDLLNTTATTVNAFGAATTINVGGSATVLNFGGGATAAEFRFLEPSGSGTNYSSFKAVAQGANITYSLPPTVGAAGTVLTDVAGDGVLTWAAGGGLSWGASISGTTPDGLTLTVDNSASANVTGLNITVGDTQSNTGIGGIDIQKGTNTTVYGERIVGTFGTATDGSNAALVLHANTASGNGKLISGGNGTTFTESFFIRGNGLMTLQPINSGTALTINCANNTNDVTFSLSGGTGNYTGILLNTSFTSTSATLTNRSNQYYNSSITRTSTRTSGTTADNYDGYLFRTTSVQNGSGGTFTRAGSVMKVENAVTQMLGTMTDSAVVLKLVQDADSTGVPLEITQNAVVSTNFKKVIAAAGVTIWVSDGTDPNGALSGTAGDVCFNCNGNVIKYCTGTTNWA